jgi:hypothetical protein
MPQKRTLTKLEQFPHHMLKSYVVSPSMRICAPTQEIINDHCESLSTMLAEGESLKDAALFMFEDLYEQGWIWYPRDRWRTAWMIALICIRKSMHDVPNGLKVYLYGKVGYLRNPSSPYEALK